MTKPRWSKLVGGGAAIAIFLIALPFALQITNPLRRSDDAIETWLLAQTPLNTSLEAVRAYASEEGWFHPSAQGTNSEISDRIRRGEIKDYLRGELGEYRGPYFPFITSVTVFWEFDENARLVNITIWKTRDAL